MANGIKLFIKVVSASQYLDDIKIEASAAIATSFYAVDTWFEFFIHVIASWDYLDKRLNSICILAGRPQIIAPGVMQRVDASSSTPVLKG